MTVIEPGAPDGTTAAPVEVVVVAYGAADLLDRCLAALGRGFPVLVVDNSSDRAVRDVATRHGAEYVDPGDNLGFAGGVNVALARRGTGDVLLLNPDAAISPTDVGRLRECLHRHTDVSCAAPRQTDPEHGEEARVAWPFPTPWGAWVEALGFGSLRNRPDFMIGSVLLLRAAAVDDIGPFDERFFLYAEEIDWQRRACDRGWRSILCPDITATHVGAGTGGDTTVRETHFHASHERYIRKHFGSWGWAVYRSGVGAGALVPALVLPGERRHRAGLRFRLFVTGPCRAEARLDDERPTDGPLPGTA